MTDSRPATESGSEGTAPPPAAPHLEAGSWAAGPLRPAHPRRVPSPGHSGQGRQVPQETTLTGLRVG